MYQLIESQESITGLLSVVDEKSAAGGRGLRLLRCDHSLIGGVYLGNDTTPTNPSNRGGATFHQSIFGSFYFPTFVRYIEGKRNLAPSKTFILQM